MTDSTAIPRGIHRDPSSGATPPRPDPTRSRDVSASSLSSPPATAVHYVDPVAVRCDNLSRRIAAEQMRRLEELAHLGHRTQFSPMTRAVAEVSLRRVIRTALEVVLRED